MKKILTLLALMLALANININATVTITKPDVSIPDSLNGDIVYGNSYYIINTAFAKYLYPGYDSFHYTCLNSTPYKIQIGQSGGATTLKWLEGRKTNYYIQSTSSDGTIRNEDRTSPDWDCYFTLVKDTLARYKIQLATNNYFRYYNYTFSGQQGWNVGYESGWGRVRHGLWYCDDWLILPATIDSLTLDSYRLKYAKLNLYNAILRADTAYTCKPSLVTDYEKIYNDNTKTTDEIQSAANTLNNLITNTNNYTSTNAYVFPSWNDYNIGLYSSDFSKYSDQQYLYASWNSNQSGTTKSITAIANITEPSTFVISTRCENGYQQFSYCPMLMQIYVDDSLQYTFDGEMYYNYYYNYMDNAENYQNIIQYNYNSEKSSYGYRRHFVDLPVGEHKIEVRYKDQRGESTYVYINSIGIEKTPLITVNNAAEGRLGDEILRALDNLHPGEQNNIRDIRKLKVSGLIGSDDWATIKTLTSLYALDMSETNITSVPDQFFSRITNPSYTGFLNQMKLPKAVKSIGYESFLCSYIKGMELPDSLETVGRRAFAYSYQDNAIMPNVKTIYSYAFQNCYNLKTVVTNKLESLGQRAFLFCHNMDSLQLYGTLKTVPYYAFFDCEEIKGISLSDSIETIQHCAFYYDYTSTLNRLPKNLKTINSNAFFVNTHATFSLPEGLKTIENNALQSVDRMKGTIPESVTSIGNYGCQYTWWSNPQDTLKLNPNCTYGEGAFRYARVKNIVIPESFTSLQQAYLFANNDSLKSIRLNSPIKVSVASTFVSGLDKSKIKVYVPSYLYYDYRKDSYWADFNIQKFSTTEMDSIIIRDNLAISQHDRFEGTPSVALLEGKTLTLEGAAGMDLKNMTLNNNLTTPSYSQLWTSTDSVKVTGDMIERLYTAANKWYFITLPFDCQLSKLKNESNANYAIRYYDGASRAKMGMTTYPESSHNYELNRTEANSKQSFSYPGAEKLTLTFSSSTYTYNSYHKIYIKDSNGNTTSYYGNIGRRTITLAGDHFDIWMVTSDYNYNDYRRYGYSFESIYANDTIRISNTKENWKNYDCASDTIKAGTGFIFMTSKDSWTEFHSVANGTRNTVFFSADNVNNEQHFALQKNESTNSANAGWNLVGNPYPNYYNCHKISFSAPITLWNGSTYEAKSLRDDDVALKPLEAFFVQCPEDLAEISFPSAGRQLTAEIKDQSNAKAAGNAAGTVAASKSATVPSASPATVPSASPEVNRCLVDISLSDGENSDNTRLVINNSASMSYERSCDASKFMSMDNTMPQIYTLGADGTKYAINERPFENGTVQLGIYCPVDGTYTLNLTRNNAEHVYIQDSETGSTTEITSDSYSFDAKAGTNTSRLVLAVTSADITGIAEVNADKATVSDASPSVSATDGIYTLDGRKALNTNAPGTYILRSGSKVKKVLVK